MKVLLVLLLLVLLLVVRLLVVAVQLPHFLHLAITLGLLLAVTLRVLLALARAQGDLLLVASAGGNLVGLRRRLGRGGAGRQLVGLRHLVGPVVWARRLLLSPRGLAAGLGWWSEGGGRVDLGLATNGACSGGGWRLGWWRWWRW